MSIYCIYKYNFLEKNIRGDLCPNVPIKAMWSKNYGLPIVGKLISKHKNGFPYLGK